jgi:nucleoside-diphosphate-sugar epimerase
MRIFVAGATGAVGARLVPMLVAEGHEVVAMTRTADKTTVLRETGAIPVVADGLDRDAVRGAVLGAEPEVVIHQMTALAQLGNLKHFDREFAVTNRLRTEGTDHLLGAAQEAGARRFIAQSYAGWPYAPEGGPVKSEDDRLDPRPLADQRESFAAIRHLEQVVPDADGLEGIVLRYGGLYGPGTSVAPGGEHLEMIRRRKWPVVGSGAGVWSFCHVDDAAGAAVRALRHGDPGIYNIVDDRPAPVREWLPAIAEIMGAKPPRRVPAWVGRLVVGEVGVAMMTEVRGASNAKARREMGWEPRYPDWREAIAAMVRGSEREAVAA